MHAIGTFETFANEFGSFVKLTTDSGRAAGHNASLSQVTMCTMHLSGAIPNAGRYLEFSIEGSDSCPWQDGHVTSPSSPGWGVEVNPA